MSDEFTTPSPTPLNLRTQPALASINMPPVVQEWVDRAGGPRRMAMVGVGIGAIAVILGIAHWATAPSWVPVSSNLPLESVQAIKDRLDEEGIEYRSEGDGTELKVSATDLPNARVALASEGMLTVGDPGMEIFDQPAWGMTDFTQRVQYRRALEGELEGSIGKLRGVERVQVHIAMDETAGIRRSANPPKASVMLRLRGGGSPSAEMVQGITQLVSGSVPGIEPAHVMVLDDTGQLLSSPFEEGSPAALASRELKMRSEVEEYLAAKAQQIVGQIVGAGNVRVQVAAELNLDKIERTIASVDPENQVMASENRSEIIPGAQGGAGSTSVQNTYLNSTSTEVFSGAVGNVKRITAAILINDELVVDSAGGETYQARSPEVLAEIEQLVSSAMGIDPNRGDQIKVASIPFEAGLPIDDSPSITEIVVEFQRPAMGLIALLLTLVIAFRVTRTVKGPNEAEKKAAALKAGTKGGNLHAVVGAEGQVLTPGDDQAALPPPGPNRRELVAAHIDENPEMAVKMMRSWIRED